MRSLASQPGLIRNLSLLTSHPQGHAVKRGVACARGEAVLFMDADGATRVSDLELLEADLRAKQQQQQVRAERG